MTGTASDWAILSFAAKPDGALSCASVNWTARALTNLSAGIEAGGMQADHRGIGNAIVVASGNITVIANAGLGTTQYGLLAHAGDPTIQVRWGPAMRP